LLGNRGDKDVLNLGPHADVVQAMSGGGSVDMTGAEPLAEFVVRADCERITDPARQQLD